MFNTDTSSITSGMREKDYRWMQRNRKKNNKEEKDEDDN